MNTLQDAHIVAAIKTLYPDTKIYPFCEPASGHVYFDIDNVDVGKAVSEMYKNPSIPLMNYITNFKMIRSAIFALKQGKR